MAVEVTWAALRSLPSSQVSFSPLAHLGQAGSYDTLICTILLTTACPLL